MMASTTPPVTSGDASPPPSASPRGAGSRPLPALRHEADAVEGTPGDERPARSMPEAADQHRQEDVPVGKKLAGAVAAERGVDVVSRPEGESHVPATPEVLQRDRRVGGVG